MKAPWATYSMPLVCRSLIDGYTLGLDNIYQFEGIENDPLLTSKRNMDKLPDQTVLRKDLTNQFKNDEDVMRLRRVKSRQARGQLKRLDGNLVLEYDSTKRDCWSKARRVVVIRWQDEMDRAQTNLFDALGYTYSVFVTNLDWCEEDIYRSYDKRADVENHIREGKADFSIDHISTQYFHANAADFELRLLALTQVIPFAKNILSEKYGNFVG